MVSVTYDATLGVVRVSGAGSYALGDGQRTSPATQAAIERCRAEHHDLKVLITCEALVEDADAMSAAARRETLTPGRNDRVAFVCGNSLTKLQASRLFRGEKSQCFLSENAAVTWLLADRGAARIRAA